MQLKDKEQIQLCTTVITVRLFRDFAGRDWPSEKLNPTRKE